MAHLDNAFIGYRYACYARLGTESHHESSGYLLQGLHLQALSEEGGLPPRRPSAPEVVPVGSMLEHCPSWLPHLTDRLSARRRNEVERFFRRARRFRRVSACYDGLDVAFAGLILFALVIDALV